MIMVNRMYKTERMHSLDKLKTLCSFLVVCIHAPFPGEFGKYFMALTRIAVPIFFMISGYFYNQKTCKEQKKKIALLTLYANAFYFIYGIIEFTT